MPFSDDIILRLGLDPRKFNKELKGARAKVVAFGKQLGGIFAVGGAVALTRRVLDFADSIDTMSKTIGTSAEFLQGWQQANLQSGVAVEKSTMGLQRFSRRLAEAQKDTGVLKEEFEALGISLVDKDGAFRSLQAVLADYTDAIANTENEQEQLRLAFKAFDAEGAQIVTTLKSGSAQVERLIANATKLTQKEVEDLAAARQELEKLNVKSTTLAGKTIGLFRQGFSVLWTGFTKGAFAGADALNEVLYDVPKIEKSLTKQKEIKEDIERLDKKGTNLLFVDLALQAQKLAIMGKQHEMVMKVNDAYRDRALAMTDRTSISIGELAAMQPGDRRIQSQSAVDKVLKARRILAAEERAQFLALNGKQDFAEAVASEAVKMRGELSILPESDQFPLKRMDENIATLTQAALKEGIVIIPQNGR